jgi:hypothetical protein
MMHVPMPWCYQIRVNGHLDPSWSAWFDGLTITHDADGATTIRGPVVDQAALYGLIGRARDLGLILLAVNRGTADGLGETACASPSASP